MHILFNGYHLCWDPALVFCTIFSMFESACVGTAKYPANAIVRGLRAVAKEI